MTVRVALQPDENPLFDLLMSLARDNNTFDFRVSDARVKETIMMGTHQKGGIHGVIDAPDRPGVLAASLGMVWDRLWFSDEWGLAQIWLYVRPEYRKGTGYADELVNWSKEIRRDLETRAGHRVRMANSVISETRLDAKLRFWRKHSGEMIGAMFEIS